MQHKYLENTELSAAQERFKELILARCKTVESECIDVRDALGRITAEPVYAKISAPHYAACAMDGVALSARDTFGASPTAPVRLKPEQYMRIDTGDPLPEDCDAVVMIEEIIERDDGEIELMQPASPWQHVRQIGEDVCMGEMILPQRECVTPAAIGAFMSAGVLQIKVVKKPLVAIIPTGDEIVPPTGDPKDGEIIEFNSAIFLTMLEQFGAKAKIYPIVEDNLSAIEAAIKKAADECDIVLLNAGSSAGRGDYAITALTNVGELLLHGIAIKPGKPTALGIVNSKPLICVPGYPVSGVIVMEQIVQPVISVLSGIPLTHGETVTAGIGRKMTSSLKHHEFVQVKLSRVGDKLTAVPLSRGAGVLSALVRADGIMELPMDCEGLETGQAIEVNLFRSRRQIDETIAVVGSHDPLIDEIINISKTRGDLFFSSSHIGSIGGIMAVKRGEAHLAGIHLLDEKDGSYNVSYVKQHFKDGNVRLMRGVGRQQGFIVQKGNQKNISCAHDLLKAGVSYVNRQKGAGTRILFDYILNNENISSEDIYGYDREEFTHMSVAAQIRSSSADAGLGIYSAARAFGLDFVPVCTESYDFLVSPELDDRRLQMFIDILTGREFLERLDMLGGYTYNDIGQWVTI